MIHSTPRPSRKALTEAEVALQLNMSTAVLRRWRLLGKGPRFHRFGRAVRYLESDVNAFIDAHAAGAR